MSGQMLKRTWAISAAFALALAALACSKPTQVEIKPAELTFRNMKASRNLNVTILDQKGRAMADAKAAYVSSAPEVAKVDEGGRVTALSSGDAVISVTSGKAVGQAKVTVRIVSGIEMELPPSGAIGAQGTVVPLAVRALDENGSETGLDGIQFSSSDPAVASVDSTGRLTLLAEGRTVISASVDKVKADLPVDVSLEVPMAIKVEKQTQTVTAGASSPLEFAVISDKGRPMQTAVVYEVSPAEVAQVDDRGNVTGLKRGTATVTLTAGNAKNTIRVTVR